MWIQFLYIGLDSDNEFKANHTIKLQINKKIVYCQFVFKPSGADNVKSIQEFYKFKKTCSFMELVEKYPDFLQVRYEVCLYGSLEEVKIIM